MVFGRASEEIAALRGAGIPIEVVPGVTAGLGAAASLQIRRPNARRRDGCSSSPRMRMTASCPRISTGARSATRAPRASSIWASGRLGPWPSACWRMAGDPATPAPLVERATCPDERRIGGSIATLPAKAAAQAPSGPCLILIGAVFAAQADVDPAHRLAAAAE